MLCEQCFQRPLQLVLSAYAVDWSFLHNTSGANTLGFEGNFVLKAANSPQYHWLEAEKSSSGDG